MLLLTVNDLTTGWKQTGMFYQVPTVYDCHLCTSDNLLPDTIVVSHLYKYMS